MSHYGAPPPPPASMPYGEGYGQGPAEHPKGTLILILGILSLVCFQLIGPFAWVMGNNALREIDANPDRYSNRGFVQAGRICGIVATALLVVGVILWILLLALGVLGASTSTS